jgi:hypothetical protein
MQAAEVVAAEAVAELEVEAAAAEAVVAAVVVAAVEVEVAVTISLQLKAPEDVAAVVEAELQAQVARPPTEAVEVRTPPRQLAAPASRLEHRSTAMERSRSKTLFPDPTICSLAAE